MTWDRRVTQRLLVGDKVVGQLYGIVKLFGNGCGAVDVSGLGGER